MTGIDPSGAPVLPETLLAQLLERVDERFNEAVELAQHLIKQPSENHPPGGDEGPAQAVLSAWLNDHGLGCDVFQPDEVEGIQSHPEYRAGRDYANRPNVVTRLVGAGGGRSLLLTGHMDTVDRGPERWPTAGPFTGSVIGDRLYGRGSYDMKAAIAAAAVVVDIIKTSSIPLRGDLLLGSVVDEERCGGNGTLALGVRGYRADAAVLMEMTDLSVCTSTKGAKVYEVEVQGQGGHSSLPQGASPIEAISRVVLGLRVLERRLNAAAQTDPDYAGDPVPRPITLGVLRTDGSHNDWDFGTVQLARVRFVILTLPGQTERALDEEIQEGIEQLWESDGVLNTLGRPVLRGVSDYVYPSVSSSAAIHQFVSSAMQQANGAYPLMRGATFACDAGLLVDVLGIPTTVFGPAGANAHTADEYVSLSSLREFMRAVAVATVAWCQ